MRQIMYVGPTIRGVVRKNQVFNYAPDEIIAKASERSQTAKYLFVKMDEIVEKKQELRREGSLLYAAYKTLDDGKEGGNHGEI